MMQVARTPPPPMCTLQSRSVSQSEVFTGAHERRQEEPRFGFCCALTCQGDSRGFGGEFRGLAPCETDLLDFALM